jgi:hypothetical protein
MVKENVFAIYKGQVVMVIEIEDWEALISFDNGKEDYVSLETLNFI